MTTPLDDQLRAWAKGMYPCEAATELLIRTGWARPGLPWVKRDNRPWIDFDAIPDAIGAYSGGEQRILRIAASIGGDESTVILGDDVSGLDREHLDLVLAAIAHAGGSHEHSRFDIGEDDQVRIRRFDTLHRWPNEVGS